MPQPILIVDACVLLNLLASDEAEGILTAFDHEYLISESAAEESLFLRAEDQGKKTLQAVSLNDLIHVGLLRICVLENPREENLFLNYASYPGLGDGEAMSLAIAHARGYKVATDDRKARGVFAEAIQGASRIIYTSDLVRKWVEQEAIDATRLKAALFNIRTKARFFPPKRDPNHAWWMRFLDS